MQRTNSILSLSVRILARPACVSLKRKDRSGADASAGPGVETVCKTVCMSLWYELLYRQCVLTGK